MSFSKKSCCAATKFYAFHASMYTHKQYSKLPNFNGSITFFLVSNGCYSLVWVVLQQSAFIVIFTGWHFLHSCSVCFAFCNFHFSSEGRIFRRTLVVCLGKMRKGKCWCSNLHLSVWMDGSTNWPHADRVFSPFSHLSATYTSNMFSNFSFIVQIFKESILAWC